MRRACRAIAWLSLVWLVGAGLALPAWAHKPSDSYLTLRVEPGKIDGQWDIALRDLDHAIGLDADDNGEITWGELRASHPEIAAYALARLQVAGDDQACALSAGEQLVDQHSDGAYAVLRFTVACAQPPTVLRIGYRLFADTDPQHRGLLRLETVGASRSAIFSPEAPQQTFALATPGRWAQFVAYARDGVWHIWIGYDHILFLLSLLLPAVGASMNSLPGLSVRSLCIMPLSVATMNSRASSSRAAFKMAEVEPTASARAITSAGDSGCTSTLAFGCSFLSASSSKALNSSCTMQAPCQNTMSAPVSRWM